MWVGILGSVAPCVLYGSNVERLGSSPGTFTNHCLPYSFLYMLGKSLFGGNCLAPWFSYPTRSAIRRKFNLEASLSLFTILMQWYLLPFINLTDNIMSHCDAMVAWMLPFHGFKVWPIVHVRSYSYYTHGFYVLWVLM